MRPLNSDDLGEKGERRFGELCADARLTANAVVRDRAGFDYIVDFRLPDGPTKNLDGRPAPASIRVQVKTHWSDRNEIRLRLSAAEQLVKHHGPSFICALAVRPDSGLEFDRMAVIHCRGAITERVLKRLRQAEAQKEKPNKVWITIKLSDFGPSFSVDHSALRGELEAVVRESPLNYLKAKNAELESVGFGPGARELRINFRATQDDVFDAFLGLKPLDVLEVSGSQTRFGITLPVDELQSGPAVLHISPNAERCELTAKVGDLSYKFRGKTVRPPSHISSAFGPARALIVADLLQIVVTVTEDNFRATFSRDQSVDLSSRFKIGQWRDLYAVLSGMVGEGVEFKLKPLRRPPLSITAHDPDADAKEDWEKLARLTQAGHLILTRAGCPNAKVSMDDLWRAGDDLSVLAAMVRDPKSVSGVNFVTGPEVSVPSAGPLDLMLGYSFRIGDLTIGYGAKCVVTGVTTKEGIEWSSTSLELCGIKKVSSRNGFSRFLDTLPHQQLRVLTGTFAGE